MSNFQTIEFRADSVLVKDSEQNILIDVNPKAKDNRGVDFYISSKTQSGTPVPTRAFLVPGLSEALARRARQFAASMKVPVNEEAAQDQAAQAAGVHFKEGADFGRRQVAAFKKAMQVSRIRDPKVERPGAMSLTYQDENGERYRAVCYIRHSHDAQGRPRATLFQIELRIQGTQVVMTEPTLFQDVAPTLMVHYQKKLGELVQTKKTSPKKAPPKPKKPTGPGGCEF